MSLSRGYPYLYILAGLLGSSLAWAKPAALLFNAAQGTVEFKAVGNPSALVIKGEGSGPDGKLKMSDEKTIEGALRFDLKSLKTGLGLRDRHMRNKYLEVEKFPEASFTPTLVPWKDPSSASQQVVKDAPFNGKLNLHGVELPVEGTMSTQVGTANKLNCEFLFKIKLSDYKIAIPSFAEITVAETVDVIVKSQAEVQAQ